MRALVKVLLAAAAAATLAGCPAAHGSYPTRACMTNSDCYENETCDSASSTCIANTMATVDLSIVVDQGPTTGDDQ